MKHAIIILAALLAAPVFAKTTSGYIKKDGTYVAPYQSSKPNHTERDNYGTKGNLNPYTSKAGTKEPKK